MVVLVVGTILLKLTTSRQLLFVPQINSFTPE
jgi:hypothetical protein